MEEASQTTDEMSLDSAYDIGSIAHDDAGPSHTYDMRFMPTPGRPTLGAVPPEGVHTEFIPPQIPTPHQSLHTLRIGREGCNGHGHILLTVGLDMVL